MMVNEKSDTLLRSVREKKKKKKENNIRRNSKIVLTGRGRTRADQYIYICMLTDKQLQIS